MADITHNNLLSPPTSIGHRWLARTMAVSAFCGSGAILLRDAIQTGHWGVDQVLMPIVLFIVIGLGLIAERLWQDRRPVVAVLWWILFVAGTAVAVYSSVGRQTEGLEARAGAAEAHNTVLEDKTTQLAQSRDRLKEANSEIDQCLAIVKGKTICGPRATKDWQRRSIEIQALITTLEANIIDLGGAATPNAEANKVADLLALFGADHGVAMHVAITLKPFALALLFELATVFSASYGFATVARVPQPLPIQPPVQAPSPRTPAPPAKKVLAAMHPIANIDAELSAIQRHILDTIARDGKVSSLTEFADQIGTDKGSVSRAKDILILRRQISSRRVGRNLQLLPM